MRDVGTTFLLFPLTQARTRSSPLELKSSKTASTRGFKVGAFGFGQKWFQERKKGFRLRRFTEISSRSPDFLCLHVRGDMTQNIWLEASDLRHRWRETGSHKEVFFLSLTFSVCYSLQRMSALTRSVTTPFCIPLQPLPQ